ncbi:MAG: excinuclease ABC subunit UvrC [Candidatus Nanopelagicales bacterium]|nr:excinuclease ABC subunit UvrC [Candidatus Nanopelagicales bacterium]
MQITDRPTDIPTSPGVYRWRDEQDRVIYVGKAKNLKSRINSYFGNDLHPRTQSMVSTARSLDWVTVRTETEALQLEYAWIKEFDPSFNVRYRDDKSYPYLALSTQEDFPRAFVYRGDKRKGVTYFGPYVQAWAIRDSLDHLLRVFPVRSCTAGVFRNAKASGRPCLLAHIDRCSAPCIGKIDESSHRDLVKQLMSFMSGNSKEIMTDIARRMNEASVSQDYEQASVLRDDLAALERVLEKSVVVLPDDTFADIVGLSHDDLQSAVQVFSVRSGRIVGQRGFIMENSVDATSESLMTDALMHIYSGTTKDEIPTEVLVSHEPESASSLAELLGTIRQAQISVRVPSRGDKKMLMDTVLINAGQALGLHKTKRSTDLVTRSKALAEIQEALGLTDAPLRIECIDVSHISGTNVVASLVVFEDGIPKKKDYRQFIIEDPRDDTASIAQVVTRRFKDHDEKRPYRPNLLVIDGGLPQVNAAAKALEAAGVGNMHVVGLAKRMEEIWTPGASFPVILPRNSEALFMLQRVRDEAHRFAITLHRNRRSKGMVDSVLDDVPGLGPVKKKAVLAHFGSLKKVAAASEIELSEVPGIGPVQAAQIWQFLNDEESGEVAVNTATGEIIES